MSLTHKVANRYAATKTLDLEWVESMRKDFLTLLKNLPRVKDYKSAFTLRKAMLTYKERFEHTMFKSFLNVSIKEDPNLSDSDAKYVDKTLRTVAWAFNSDLSMPLANPFGSDTEEQAFYQFQQQQPAWEARLRKNAQAFWKAMKSVIEWYKVKTSGPITSEVTEDHVVNLDGFKVLLREFNPRSDNYQQEEFDMFELSLRKYRKDASARLPALLKQQRPIILDFSYQVGKGGNYNHSTGIVTFFGSSLLGKEPSWGAHILAHEMGHHVWKAFLGQGERDFWEAAIKQDLGDLTVLEILNAWPGDAWAFQFPEVLGTKDPILALQVDAISQDESYGEPQKKEDFRALLDKGITTLRVPSTPISGYANKNPEEAFCEAVGLFVTYGPRALHKEIRRWLGIILPGMIKTSSKRTIT